MRSDILHGSSFSGMAGEKNALIVSLRIFENQSQNFFHAAVIHTDEAFVK